jgi:hypothetical protein
MILPSPFGPRNKITLSEKPAVVLFQLNVCSGTFPVYFHRLVDIGAAQQDGVRKTSRELAS